MKPNILAVILKIFFFAVVINLFGCSVESKLSSRYKGKNEGYLIENMGKPVTVYRDKGKKVDVYEKKTMLRTTPISTGGFKYDRFDSPKAIKIETFKFSINSSGIVEKVEYDYRYER
jgi:hypothetical protein